jgi:hypothetical protein
LAARWQRGIIGGSTAAGSTVAAVAAAARRQRQLAGSGSLLAAAACRQRGGGSNGGQRVGSATASGMAAAAAILPPRATAVAMKTPAVTAMAGAQTTINHQLNASTATVNETAMTMTMETKATAAAEAWWQHLGGGGQLGGRSGSLARARGWRWRQCGGSVGSSSAAVGFTKARRAMMISRPRLAWQ